MVLLVFGCLLVGCETQRPVPDGSVTGTFTDDLGREVKVPVPMNRVVSLAPSITEMLFAAGAGDRLIGVTSYCNYPAETANIQKVGDTLTPNIESIVALRPQMVFVSTDSQLESFAATLDKQGIGVYVVKVEGLDDVPAAIETFGDLFFTKEPAKNAATAFRKKVADVEKRKKGDAPPRVFLQISEADLFTIGRDSFMTELIERAGGISLTKDVSGGYPKINKETALAMDPDVIILSDSNDNREPNKIFANSKAVKNGRVYRVDADILSRPGPRLAEALEQIAEFLNR